MKDSLKIDEYVNSIIKSKKIPGCYLFAMHKGKIICHKGYGVADSCKNKKVDVDTYFQLGSNSKAFTALAILHLERQNKLKRSDDVSKYIPEFQVYFKKKKVKVTIENLLYHTSGISPKTIMYIEEDREKNALAKTVRILEGKETIFRPGEKFLYATINYDVLGYIIEVVTKTSYENYIKEELFESIGLNKEGVGFVCFPDEKIAKGYKREFLRNVEYRAPVYKGNVPSGYIYLNGIDMSKWIQFQLSPDKQWKKLIEESHKICEEALIKKDTYYAAGWQVETKKGIVSHFGRNPNYVSCIYLKPEEKTGVAIMTNTSLTYAKDIGEQILCILDNKKASRTLKDSMVMADIVSSILIFFQMCFILSLFFLIVRNIVLNCFNPVCFIKLIITCIGMGGGYHLIKKLVKRDKKIFCVKKFIKVWTPKSVVGVMFMFFLSVCISIIYLISK